MIGETRRLLDSHTPADPAESRHRIAMLGLLDAGGDPFSRHRYHPGHFTASAFVASPDGSAVLLVDHPKVGRWLQPGGHVEPADPSPLAAARREVAEEAGLTDLEPAGLGLFDVDVHTFHAHADQPTHLHFDLRFLFRSPTMELSPGAEVGGARWVPLGDVIEVSGEPAMARPVAKLSS